jgi:hypothetical protein
MTRFKSLNNLMQELSIADIEASARSSAATAADVASCPRSRPASLRRRPFQFGLFSAAQRLVRSGRSSAPSGRQANHENAAYNYLGAPRPGRTWAGRWKMAAREGQRPAVKVQAGSRPPGGCPDLRHPAVIINVFVILLFFVAVIIIADTLSRPPWSARRSSDDERGGRRKNSSPCSCRDAALRSVRGAGSGGAMVAW